MLSRDDPAPLTVPSAEQRLAGELEQSLRDSHYLLGLATSTAGAGWVIWDPDTGAAALDARGREIIGFPDGVSAVTGEDFLARIHPVDLPVFRDRLRESVAAGGDVAMRFRIVRGDGRVRIVHGVGHLTPVAGDLVRGTGLVRDVTDEVATEEALRASQQFLRRVLDNVVAFVAVLSPQGTLQEINAGALEVGGVPADDVVGRPFWECWWWTYSPESVAGVRDAVERARRGQRLRYDTLVRVAGDGRLWIDFQIAPLLDATGRVTHLIASALDLTDRKQVEEELRAKEAEERRERERAQLLAEVMGEIQAGPGVDERAGLLVELLVPRLAAAAAVEIDGARLALAGDAEELRPTGVVVRLELGGRTDARLLVPGGLPRDAMATVREIAARAAVPLADARLREEEHRIAVQLQRALLPDRLVEHPRVRLAARYRAADAVLLVGGDWYDSWQVPDGRVGLSVGDVVGHGLASAAAMGRLRAALAALAAGGAEPAQVLTDLDRFARGVDRIEFATACCVLVDPDTGVMTHASAGHPPALVVPPHGPARFLSSGGLLPLGVPGRDRPSRPQAQEALRPGSLLVLYSDGLVERPGTGVREGLERLRAAADAMPDRARLSPDDVCGQLLEELTTGAHIRDDIVVLCARLVAPPEPVAATR